MNEGSVLRIRGLVKKFPTAAGAVDVLRGVDLDLPMGGRMAVVGPSGSGKSTLLHLIGGLDRADAGTILVAGTDLATADEAQRSQLRAESVGMVFQSHHLLPQCSAWENAAVASMASRAKPRKEPIDARLNRLFSQVGLSHRLEHRPSRLSGGECQRVALVRALANEPSLLLADEPTGALDAESAQRLLELLLTINEKEGVALLVITHDLNIARQIGNVHRMQSGILVPETTP